MFLFLRLNLDILMFLLVLSRQKRKRVLIIKLGVFVVNVLKLRNCFLSFGLQSSIVEIK